MNTYPGWSATAYESPGLFTLSNGTNTFTFAGGADGQININSAGASTGKFYFEATLGSSNPGNYCCGLVQTNYSGPNSRENYGTAGSIWTYEGGGVDNNGHVGPGPGGWGAGNLGCAVDLDAKLVWFRFNGGPWNSDTSQDPVAGTGGYSIAGMTYPLVPFASYQANAPGSLTVNTGGSVYLSAAPTGYGSWPAAETITLSTVSGQVGSPLYLTGSTANGVALSLDYTTDGGNTWSTATSYSGGASWTARGPSYPGTASGLLQVRDSNNPSILSGTVGFRVSNGTLQNSLALGAWTKATECAGSPNWNDGQSTINCGFAAPGGTDYLHTSQAAASTVGTLDDFVVAFDFINNAPVAWQFVVGLGSVNPNEEAAASVLFDRNAVANQTQPGVASFFAPGITTPPVVPCPSGGAHVELHLTLDRATGLETSALTINGVLLATSPAVPQKFAWDSANPPTVGVYSYNVFPDPYATLVQVEITKLAIAAPVSASAANQRHDPIINWF